MAIFLMRFDFRNPPIAQTSMSERYGAALDMAEWADRLGFYAFGLSEHHGSDDGYLPSPLAMAAAVAARTKNVRIMIAALITPFHDPLRLAEDTAVIDHISAGRLDLVLAAGYVPAEFEMFGVPVKERAKRVTETVHTLRAAWTGEPFEYRGRTVRVTPAAYSPKGPGITLGGSSEAAARRAARLDIGFTPTDGDTWEFYRDETIKLGRPDPGPHFGRTATFIHVAHDVDAGWEKIAPYALHESNAYGAWLTAGGSGTASVYQAAESAEALRETGQYRVLTPAELVNELREQGPFALCNLTPMMGGIPPEIAWESLRLIESEVIPALAAEQTAQPAGG
ncbi:LLM class flavin-dependent oxidoreductase [Pseudofrankia inefficax]|uniref:Luciferase-like, subgroup n=1 Tax=Pseudofrankia inefficax (strain DSM 45817 / CECT 9037 / DDB 130130 / EuI1c) TaxID=298654 RepID=E3JAT6_PSEI1|nr:LLM class flavin-dependent oxidoreductase [Pseudofrankia inefficax]ADP83424.1 Luciferase-like, subgroup [Pseudofrankia inefficax]